MAILWVRQADQTRRVEFVPPARLSEVLTENGISQAHPCGGRGFCRLCRVLFEDARQDFREDILREATGGKEVLSCQTILTGDAVVTLPEKKSTLHGRMSVEMNRSENVPDSNAEDRRPESGALGASVDIGTTTIAMVLVDMETGSVLAESGTVNPQTEIGADVISRIASSLEGHAERLQALVTEAIRTLLTQCCQKADVLPEKVERLVITGNTTMLYLLTGENPEPLSHAPFEADDLFGRWEKVQGSLVYLPPCMDAFVGADITCALLECDPAVTYLLCDVGTNGEVALHKDGKLFVTSTAAGPAFESLGVFGSVLVDALAGFLEDGTMDETGYLEEEPVEVAGRILTQKDIRGVQLAKAAIRAGMETLLAETHTSVEEIRCLYIAGGFGSHLNMDSAVRIGLIPASLKDKAKVIGNASLAGAIRMLLSDGEITRAEKSAAASTHVELGGNPLFNDLYVEQMLFPEA